MINITVNTARELTSDIYTIGNEGDCGIEQFTIKIPKSYNNVDFSQLNTYLLGRFSSGECEKLPLGAPQIGEDDLTFVADVPQTLYISSGNLTLSVCVEKTDGTIYWSSIPNNGFKVLQSIAADGEIAQKYPTILQEIQTELNENIPEDLSLKVDKAENMSLISDSEISRLAGMTTTDGLPEGNNNQYFTNGRVNGVIDAQKGQPNGLATINEQGMMEQNAIYSYEAGAAYAAKSGSGLETAINGKVDKVSGKSLVDDNLILSIPKKGAKVAEIITANNAAEVVFNNLDILADGSFYHIYIIGGNGTSKNLYMTINGRETAGDYRNHASSTPSSPAYNPQIATVAGGLCFIEIDIGLQKANSSPVAKSSYGTYTNPNAAETAIRFWWYEPATEANITSVKFATSDGSAFANDIKFAMFKMGT